MQQVIMAIHLMVVVALVALVLYQKSEGGALGIGQSGLFSGRGQANALTRATSILGALFFVTSILLTVLPAWERRAAGGDDWTTAIDQKQLDIKEIKPPANAPAPANEKPVADEKQSIFDQLKRAQEQRRTAGPKSDTAPPAPGGAPEESPLRPSTEAAPQTTAPAEGQRKN
jgi:protein translocase SecG subunit